jgi:hypothetical protein
VAGEAIRDGFADKLDEIVTRVRRTNAKLATAYYRVSETYDYELTHDELLLVAARLGYQPGWAWFKHQEQPARRDTWIATKEQMAAAEKERTSGWSDNWQDFMRGDPYAQFQRAQRQQQKNEEAYNTWKSRGGFKQGPFKDPGPSGHSGISREVLAAINLLGLKPKFTEAELKSAYRKYVMTHHPDRGGTAEKFQAGVTANELLQHHAIKDPEEAPF